MVNISKITSSDLLNGKYRNFFPDFYATKGLIEKNAWHDSQDVFEHSLAVFEAYKKLLSQKNQKLQNRLSSMVENLTREEILTLVVIFHDVGKKIVFTKSPDNTTMCPLHEVVSSQMVLEKAKSLGLLNKELEIVSFLVSLHGEISIVAAIYENKKDKKILDLFSRRAKGWDAELTLFMLADLEGSDLKKINPPAFASRKQTLEKMLDYYL